MDILNALLQLSRGQNAHFCNFVQKLELSERPHTAAHVGDHGHGHFHGYGGSGYGVGGLGQGYASHHRRSATYDGEGGRLGEEQPGDFWDEDQRKKSAADAGIVLLLYEECQHDLFDHLTNLR